ncbi:uncharacterized protein [Nicotiana sylvestris]|uniref:uncharacterized protein n=1 Tax=Nicotiana sylvestris TaxID=4096 RepID=UPI00388CB205
MDDATGRLVAWMEKMKAKPPRPWLELGNSTTQLELRRNEEDEADDAAVEFHHLGWLVADPFMRYVNGQTWPVVLQADIDELHIIHFHDWAKDMGYLTVDKYACKINQKEEFRLVKYDADVLAFCEALKDGDYIDVYLCHTINTPCLDLDLDEMLSSDGLNVDPTDVQPFSFNEMPHGQTSDVNARATHSPNNEINKGDNTHGKGKERVAENDSEIKESSEDEDDFYNFHLTNDSEGDVEDESLYGADEDIVGETSDLEPEVVAARQAKVNAKRSKLRSSKVNTDEIHSGPVGMDPGFEDMYKDRGSKYAGKLGGDEQYLDSSDPGSEDTYDEVVEEDGVSKHFKDKIINQPDIKLRKLHDLIRIKYGLFMEKFIYARAKHQVMGQYLGNYKQEFARIYDYADILKSTNPGSIVVVKTCNEIIPGKEVFVGIYICLHACKVGWLEGCRNVIGFDGAFLKDVCKGELLLCIGKDGNNQIYPIAWAVVEKETKHTWS